MRCVKWVQSAVYAVAFLMGANWVRAELFAIPVDTGASQVTVELCILSECDDDTSALAGSTTIELDDADAPSEITLHDFELSLVDTLNLNITFHIGPFELGSIDVIGTGLGFSYATPGMPVGPVPLVDGAFTFTGVTAAAVGTITYDSDGIVCDFLDGSGLPCGDTVVLDGEQQTADFAGTLIVTAGVATLASAVSIEVPLDPKNPDTGTLAIDGIATGSAEVPENEPCTADANGDGLVDPLDSGYVLSRFGCDVGVGDAECDAADANADGLVDPLDVGFVLARFGPC